MDTLIRILVIGILLGGIYGLVSMGLNLIFGVVRVINFAQGTLVMLGAYIAYEVHRVIDLPIYATFVIVVPALFVLGVILQRIVFQPLTNKPLMQIFAAFGLVILFQNIILALTKGTAKSVSSSFAATTLTFDNVRVDLGRITILCVTTALAVALYFLLQRTSFGRSIRAVTQDRDAARLMGINVERTYLVAFGLGAALAGVAGVLLTPVYSLTPEVGQNFIFAAFAVVVLGGLGSVTGAYVGGFVIGLVESLTAYYIDPTLGTAFYFLVFLVVLVVRPAGLFGQAGSEEVGLR